MSSATFRSKMLRATETVHVVLSFALFVGPVVAVGSGSRTAAGSFFERYLLTPIVVALIIIGLGIINFVLARVLARSLRKDAL